VEAGIGNAEGEEGRLQLRRDQVLDPDAVALPDDLRDPLPMAMQMIALVAEDADRVLIF
jgi:hypothetical protein